MYIVYGLGITFCRSCIFISLLFNFLFFIFFTFNCKTAIFICFFIVWKKIIEIINELYIYNIPISCIYFTGIVLSFKIVILYLTCAVVFIRIVIVYFTGVVLSISTEILYFTCVVLSIKIVILYFTGVVLYIKVLSFLVSSFSDLYIKYKI
jgi:hypothetical protein